MNVYKSSQKRVSSDEWSPMRQDCGFCHDLAMDSSPCMNWATCKVLLGYLVSNQRSEPILNAKFFKQHLTLPAIQILLLPPLRPPPLRLIQHNLSQINTSRRKPPQSRHHRYTPTPPQVSYSSAKPILSSHTPRRLVCL